MSALRLSQPGLPTRLVILDDGVRPVMRRWIAGSKVTSADPVKRRLVIPPDAPYRQAETCGLPMRNTQSRCARKPGHKDACRSATWMHGQAMTGRAT